MGEMENHKGQNDDSAQAHRAGEDSRADWIRGDVFFRPSFLVFLPEKHREVDVKANDRQQPEAHHPQDRAKAVELLGVGIQSIRTEEDREVANQVTDHKKHQQNTGHCDDGFFSDG